jgi:hypothetical protein
MVLCTHTNRKESVVTSPFTRPLPPSSTKKTYSTGVSCAAAIVAVLLVIPLTIFEGWTLALLWSWFVTPTFTTAPELSILTAIGLMLVVGRLVPGYGRRADSAASRDAADPIVEMFTPFLSATFITGFALSFGWIVHLIQGSPLQ